MRKPLTKRQLIIGWAIVLVLLVLFLSACSDDAQSAVDLQEPARGANVKPADGHYRVVPPDDITVFVNVDDHPNVVRLCLDGVAFATISRTYQGTDNLTRVPEWDALCPPKEQR